MRGFQIILIGLLVAAPLVAQDTTPPAIVSVAAAGDGSRIVVVFSKPVDKLGAETPGNYRIEPELNVISAQRGTDLRSVTLTTAAPAEGKEYTLTVERVTDCLVPANAVVPGTARNFRYSKGIFGGSEPAPARSRVNHAGRPLLPLPKFKQPLLSTTPEADAVVSALQIFPTNNPWNEDISKRPVHPDSDRMVAHLGRNKALRAVPCDNFVLVPPTQPRVDVRIADPGNSDKGLFPIPDNAPVQGWPSNGLKLEDWQREGEGDRRVIVVDPWNAVVYEFYAGRRRGGAWEAKCEATFDLRSNGRKIEQGISNAAGICTFAAIPRYDECERGMVEHALRLTAKRTRKACLYPATRPYSGNSDDPTVAAFGQRFRLKAGVDLSGLSKHAKAIALALKKYGMILMDNGDDWDIGASSDPRISGLEMLRRLKGSDFEVIVSTGEQEGPRAAGAR
jgi:hypothetical protein